MVRATDSVKAWEDTLDQSGAALRSISDAWLRVSKEMPTTARTMEDIAGKCDASATKIHAFGEGLGAINVPTGIKLTDMIFPMIGSVRIYPELVMEKMIDKCSPGLDAKVKDIAQDTWAIKGNLLVFAGVVKSFSPDKDAIGPALDKACLSTNKVKVDLAALRATHLARLTSAVHQAKDGLSTISTMSRWLTALVVLIGCGFALVGVLAVCLAGRIGRGS